MTLTAVEYEYHSHVLCKDEFIRRFRLKIFKLTVLAHPGQNMPWQQRRYITETQQKGLTTILENKILKVRLANGDVLYCITKKVALDYI